MPNTSTWQSASLRRRWSVHLPVFCVTGKIIKSVMGNRSSRAGSVRDVPVQLRFSATFRQDIYASLLFCGTGCQITRTGALIHKSRRLLHQNRSSAIWRSRLRNSRNRCGASDIWTCKVRAEVERQIESSLQKPAFARKQTVRCSLIDDHFGHYWVLICSGRHRAGGTLARLRGPG